MALGETDITTAKVGAEIGSPSRSVTPLVGAAGLNPFSYYAPGQLGVDANKNIKLYPPTTNFKLGDFRLYNHLNPFKPEIITPVNPFGWYDTNITFTLPYSLGNLNLYAFTERGDYIKFKFYLNSTDRTNEVNPMWQDQFLIPVTPDVPLVGHSRQSSHKINTTGLVICTFLNKFTSWMDNSGANDDVFVEAFICDIAGNRKINLGTARTDGYRTIQFYKMSSPYIHGLNTNIPYPPSGWTAIFPVVNSAAAPVCTYDNKVTVNVGTNAYSFNVAAKGIYGSGTQRTRIVELTNVNIILTTSTGIRTVCKTNVYLSHGSGLSCSGTLSSGSWTMGMTGEVTFENATIPANPLNTIC